LLFRAIFQVAERENDKLKFAGLRERLMSSNYEDRDFGFEREY